MRSTPSAILRNQLTSQSLARTLFQVTTSAGVGVDGIPASQIIDWPESRRLSLIRSIQNAVRNDCYRFSAYRELLLPKGRGKPPRVISVPSIRDRVLLKALTNVLVESFDAPTMSRPPQLAARTLSKAVHEGAWTGAVRIDIKDYYGSIDHSELERILAKKVRSKLILGLIRDANKTPTVPLGTRRDAVASPGIGIPQGTTLSSTLSTLYLSALDESLGSDPRFFYIRYVDDILILCDDLDASFIDRYVRSALHELKLEAHPADSGKSYCGELRHGVDFLGYHVEPKGISISRAAIQRMEVRIAKAFTKANHSQVPSDSAINRLHWDLKLLVAGCRFEGQWRGWLRFYSETTDLPQLFHLDHLVEEMCQRSNIDVKSLRPASFVRTWHMMRANSLGKDYIMDFDRWTTPRMAEYLRDIRGWDNNDVDRMDERTIHFHFNRLVRREVNRLERETVGNPS